MRADSYLEAGDVDGSAVWKRVLRAIKEIRREEPREGGKVSSASFPWYRPPGI